MKCVLLVWYVKIACCSVRPYVRWLWNNHLTYGCETWSLTLKEEHWLRVFENKVLRRIFGHERDEVTGK